MTQHTPESIKELPHTTVEQVIRFREAALRIEQQRDELPKVIANIGDCIAIADDNAESHGLDCNGDIRRHLRYAMTIIAKAGAV